jgi:hypothetical protein
MAFSHREGVAAEDDGYVMVPASESPAFVVVEAELPLEVLVGALSPPALAGDADESLTRRMAKRADSSPREPVRHVKRWNFSFASSLEASLRKSMACPPRLTASRTSKTLEFAATPTEYGKPRR